MLAVDEAVGYELGSIVTASFYLLLGQLLYVCCAALFSVPGSTGIWLFIMYYAATILTVAKDIDFFQGRFPDMLPQHMRTMVDLSIYLFLDCFFKSGDNWFHLRGEKMGKGVINTFGGFLSLLVYSPVLYFSNLALLAAVRLVMNAVLLMRLIFVYFGTEFGVIPEEEDEEQEGRGGDGEAE